MLNILDAIPEGVIATTVYVGGTVFALWAWYMIVRRLPSAFAAFTWILLFAFLATPTISIGNNATLAPASVGMIFGILTKDNYLIYSNLASMLLVLGVGLILYYCWRRYVQEKNQIVKD